MTTNKKTHKYLAALHQAYFQVVHENGVNNWNDITRMYRINAGFRARLIEAEILDQAGACWIGRDPDEAMAEQIMVLNNEANNRSIKKRAALQQVAADDLEDPAEPAAVARPALTLVPPRQPDMIGSSTQQRLDAILDHQQRTIELLEHMLEGVRHIAIACAGLADSLAVEARHSST